ARRALAYEYGATGGQADDLLDAAGTRNPPAPTPDEPAPPAGPAPRSSSNGVQVPRAVSRAAASSGGLILGGLTYVLALVYLRGGSAGLKTWLRAKFLNKTGASTPKADHSSTATTPGVGNAGSGFTLITGGGAGGAGAGVAGSSSPTTKASGGGW
ncbi:MAG: hypothetical protein J0I87_12940, partial [Cellulomonas sp.]|nr:hypothetical protein [Cellulomonas sp.]